jgi:hypothetical protein
MEKLSEIRVTKFDNYKSKKGSSLLMFEELRHIKIGTYKLLVSKCRAAYDLDKVLYNELKNQLPAVTFSGEFEKGRKASEITKYNALMIIDIDKLSYEELLEKKKILSQDVYVLSFWESPSGRGLKCLIKVGGGLEKHKAVFNSLKNYFTDNFQIELDTSGKDVSRLCFSSWDENIFYNPKAEVYLDFIEDEEKENTNVKEQKMQNISLLKSAYATEGLNKADDRDTIRKIIKYLNKKKMSITDSYDQWLKVAFAISVTFSYDLGEKYFLDLCRMDKSKHNEEASINLLKSCYNKRQVNSASSVTFASVIFLAKAQGFKI